MGVCNCFMYCCTLLYVHSSIAIILMGKSELIALLNLSSWCLVMVERLFLAVPRGSLQFVIVVFPDHTHLLILLDMLAPRFNYLNLSDRFSCITAQLIAGRPSIKYPIHKHSRSSGQNGSSSICRATFQHFFLSNAESIKFFTQSS